MSNMGDDGPPPREDGGRAPRSTATNGSPQSTTSAPSLPPTATHRCRRCLRPIWAARSVRREAGPLCWRHLHRVEVAA